MKAKASEPAGMQPLRIPVDSSRGVRHVNKANLLALQKAEIELWADVAQN